MCVCVYLYILFTLANSVLPKVPYTATFALKFQRLYHTCQNFYTEGFGLSYITRLRSVCSVLSVFLKNFLQEFCGSSCHSIVSDVPLLTYNLTFWNCLIILIEFFKFLVWIKTNSGKGDSKVQLLI